MSFTIDENGTALAETRDGVSMPIDCSFEKVNGWIHGVDVQYEEIVGLCLGMSSENDRLRKLLSDIKSWDVSEYLLIPENLRARIQGELGT